MYNSSLGIFRAVWYYYCLLMIIDVSCIDVSGKWYAHGLTTYQNSFIPEKAYRHGGEIDPRRGIYCAVVLFLFDCKRYRQCS
jgi:hypothetical protein